ncbi:FAD dependent oxidoreductase [Mucilaginibacter gracilis]|uniref:FAD dependent oxidoreductase n=1 Tax=Mucilaginibacter gracilis TaxID=423350 RepID=A0A495IUF1_9SPHI|nr:FAD-dependent oxidoreductase [Mucilaginibacter gracilis]RKR79931.1 FAD dependent oxidoreductase [Mucilaginibacter gracilis]
MIKENFTSSRELKVERMTANLVIVGGGLAGVCGAVTAARAGLKVVLVQDRPVLGGNSSSEVRLWILGATSHMGNNNRWAREGGLVDEILVENTYKNPEGNPLIFDVILLNKVVSEPNITLLLNTSVHSLLKSDDRTISQVNGFCSQNSTEYELRAPLFCDASGDGIIGFLSGASFRMGAENRQEFDEKFAPSKAYGELLGHSLYFYSKDSGKPVKYHAPDFAMADITQIPKFRSFNTKDYGCKLWWLEYGGRLDTIHDTEKIKWELWKVVYGAWNYIKNSGEFPEAENLTLEWVGMIPGKRESRRFMGDYIIKQQDIIAQRAHDDAVAYGGWSIDLHPADGIFSEKPGCNQWHSKGLYQIPYRSLYSKDINNLFLTGRIISATHVAFGSTRVMATGAYCAQAVALAAQLCKDKGLVPADIYNKGLIGELQHNLLKNGQHIPGIVLKDKDDLVQFAKLSASSELVLTELPEGNSRRELDIDVAQMLPFGKGEVPAIVFHADSDGYGELEVELRLSGRQGNFTPDVTVAKQTFNIQPGRNCIQADFSVQLEDDTYAFLTFLKNPLVKLYRSHQRVSGILSVFNLVNKAVSNYGKQVPPEDIGVDEFEFWCPERRPEGQNIALKIEPGLAVFGIENIRNGIDRPVTQPNAWAADLNDAEPAITVQWEIPQQINKIELWFDTDFDHPMESVLMTHPETVMPFCVRNYKICDDHNKVIYSKTGNYQSRNTIRFDKPITTSKLTIVVEHPSANVPAAVFAIRCY